MRFRFPNSHAYPGGRLIVEDDGNAGPKGLVEFGDGVNVIAEWHLSKDSLHLSIPAYRTAKHTEVAARSWRLVQRKDGVWRSERPD